MYYFYCPKCGFEKFVDSAELPKSGLIGNIRDGNGTPILHYPCEKCGNPHSGYMRMQFGDMDEKVYFRSVIGLYQDWNKTIKDCF